MGVLPPRPLRLDERALRKRRVKKSALAAFVALTGAAFGAGCVLATQKIFEERALWQRGVEGRILHLSGRVEEMRKAGIAFFYDYDLDVRWADAQGGEHSGKSSFGRTWKDLEPGTRAQLRYDPAAPDRFVLSWAALGGIPRQGVAILTAALGAFMLLGSAFLVREERRRLELLRLCSEDGEEVLGLVTKAWQHQGVHHLQYRLPDETRVRNYAGDAPLVVVRDGVQHVLALRSPRAHDAPFLVEADLASFELAPEVRARIATAARR